MDFYGELANILGVFLKQPVMQAGIIAFIIFLFKNRIANYWGYVMFRWSPFYKGAVLYHPTNTGETKAEISDVSGSFLTLKYESSDTRYRYIPMALFAVQSVGWALCPNPADEEK